MLGEWCMSFTKKLLSTLQHMEEAGKDHASRTFLHVLDKV